MPTIYTNSGKWIEERYWIENGGLGPPPRPFADPAPAPPEFWSRKAKTSEARAKPASAPDSVLKTFWNVAAAIYGLLMILGLLLNALGLLS